MRRVYPYLLCCIFILGVQTSTKAQDILIPAGTLLHCTLDEPNLSSATAAIGDPVICHMKSIQEFGHVVFPRGSYLGGHIEAEKEPGHFWGKGYLKLQFDRIGLPTSDLPVPSKIIAAKGFKVDKDGDIKGHGHAVRDTVEWMIPPLWAWKLIMLPARGPRPALKGEEQITLRLMDDVMVPRNLAATDYYPNRPVYRSQQPSDRVRPASFERPQTTMPRTPVDAIRPIERTASAVTPASYAAAVNPATTAYLASAGPVASHASERLTILALKSGEMQGVRSYRIDSGILNFVLPNGQGGSVDATQVDWRNTSQLNGNQDVALLLSDSARPLN